MSKWEGIGDEIHLYVPRSTISHKSLRELVALFGRYNIDMRQLEQFANDRNHQWLKDTLKFWHDKVFGRDESQ